MIQKFKNIDVKAITFLVDAKKKINITR